MCAIIIKTLIYFSQFTDTRIILFATFEEAKEYFEQATDTILTKEADYDYKTARGKQNSFGDQFEYTLVTKITDTTTIPKQMKMKF